MGIRIFKVSSSTYDNHNKFGYSKSSYDKNESLVIKLPNPDPSNFKIRSYYECNDHLVVRINYPDCTNYEGDKILVFTNLSVTELKKFKHIDPHFSNSHEFKSPIARFEPTERGMQWAINFVKTIK